MVDNPHWFDNSDMYGIVSIVWFNAMSFEGSGTMSAPHFGLEGTLAQEMQSKIGLAGGVQANPSFRRGYSNAESESERRDSDNCSSGSSLHHTRHAGQIANAVSKSASLRGGRHRQTTMASAIFRFQTGRLEPAQPNSSECCIGRYWKLAIREVGGGQEPVGIRQRLPFRVVPLAKLTQSPDPSDAQLLDSAGSRTEFVHD